MSFIGVAQVDGGTTLKADAKLAEYLSQRSGIRFNAEQSEYGQVINRLVDWRRAGGPFVARVTPYAYIVAELRGADVEAFATYTSAATNRTTYRSYLVVNRAGFSRPPGLADVQTYLAGRRARFIYHSEFSTSSFFLPSLFFRSHNIFNMPEATGPLTAISSTQTSDGGSSGLVERVANGAADIAAVWDGVKEHFERDPAVASLGQRVYFIELPTPIPNDLLVYPSGLDARTKDQLREAIRAMPADAINIGDFRGWQDLTVAPDARLALSSLRQLAQEATSRVPIEIRATGRENSGLLEAARQAIRLSETEFVLFDADYHTKPDVVWTLEPIHDGAVVLRSSIPGGYDVDDQVFQISFRDADDLTSRIVSIVQNRLHRIRYVWSYTGNTPIVLRNSAFAMPVGAPVKVQRITWLDPTRNQFQGGEVFESHITHATFYRYDLADEDFRRPSAGSWPDPLSNSAYRVILLRPVERAFFFRALTTALVGLFLLAGLTAGWAMVRSPGRPALSERVAR
jgi:ABC-type phosphate/phosphonate transport system substrate-binding protein